VKRKFPPVPFNPTLKVRRKRLHEIVEGASTPLEKSKRKERCIGGEEAVVGVTVVVTYLGTEKKKSAWRTRAETGNLEKGRMTPKRVSGEG